MKEDKELKHLSEMWSRSEKIIKSMSTELLKLSIKKIQAELNERENKLKS